MPRIVVAALLCGCALMACSPERGAAGAKAEKEGPDSGRDGAATAELPDNKKAESSAPGGITETEVRMDTTMPEQGSESARLVQLNGSEIRNRLIGRRFRPDQAVQPSLEFVEDFLPDGTWITNRNQRRNLVRKGIWHIVEDQICVATTDRPTLCRRVWTDSRGRIAMRDIGTTFEKILIMSDSPIE